MLFFDCWELNIHLFKIGVKCYGKKEYKEIDIGS